MEKWPVIRHLRINMEVAVDIHLIIQMMKQSPVFSHLGIHMEVGMDINPGI